LEAAGDRLWNRFNAAKDEIRWYYQSIAGKLEASLSGYAMYRELTELVEIVFN
jgi:hypothetical protein